MNNSRLKQALYYQLNSVGRSSLYVFGIAIVAFVAIGLLVTTSVDDGNTNITGMGGVGFIYLLIVGISGIREDLRFFLQHGISRSTTFFSNLYGSLICSAAIGLFCELFDLVAARWLGFSSYVPAFTAQSFFTGWMMYAFAFFFAWQIGALISLIYYRLGKMQQIVFSVSAIAAVMFAFSGAVRRLVGISDELGDIIERAVDSVLGLTSIAIWAFIAFGIVAATGNYLLLRRAQVKE